MAEYTVSEPSAADVEAARDAEVSAETRRRPCIDLRCKGDGVSRDVLARFRASSDGVWTIKRRVRCDKCLRIWTTTEIDDDRMDIPQLSSE